jgi:ABC-type molybdate transport system ATPase subunit
MNHIFKFNIQFPYLQNLSVNLHTESSRLSISGPSGSGKSSIAKAVAGIAPYSGEIYFQGRLFTDPAHKRNFSYMPQDLQLLPHLTAKQNILFPKNSRLDDELISALGLKDLLYRMPRHLSGGEKQRVAIARTLARVASLYIMDEPFSSLDADIKKTAMELVKSRTSEKALLIISHHDLELQNFNCYDFVI